MTTTDIQKLREQTGVGMMDAKRALEATHGDMAAAVEYLRKAGQKIAASKSTRKAKEGGIGVWVSSDQKRGTVVALACETDFVALTPEFQSIAEQLANHFGSLNKDALTAEQFLTQPGPDGSTTVQQFLDGVIATLGENMQIPAIAALSTPTGTIDSYLHANRKVAALVAIQGGTTAVRHDLAMHVAALNPRFLAPGNVPADLVAQEQSIYREQLIREGKPEAMLEKILPGKLKKFYSDTCLLNQPFIKDDSNSVASYLQQSGGATITDYVRIAI